MSEWTVRKAARALATGDKFIFTAELGGEGEVLEVEAVSSAFGTVSVDTPKLSIDLLGSTMLTMATREGKWLEPGPLGFDVEEHGRTVYFQVDGNDLVSIADIDEEGWATVTVFTSSDPDATILFAGRINVRERRNV